MKVKVIQVFRDKFTKHLYEIGMELEFSDEGRVEDLIERGLVEAIEEQEVIEEQKPSDKPMIQLFNSDFKKKGVIDALKTIGEKVAWNIKDENLVALVVALDEEKTTALKVELGIE